MRKARRRRFRSGSARRPAAATNCRWRCRACARIFRSGWKKAPRQRSNTWSAKSVLSTPLRASWSIISARPKIALGVLPTQQELAMERFFDESGGTQLVIHSPFGQPRQPRLGPGAAQALLPQVQLRAAGSGDRGCDRAVAVDQPQLSARRCRALSAFRIGTRGADPGLARRADVRRALALERGRRARSATLPRRQPGGAATAADEIGGSAGDGVPRSGRLRREPRRRARDSRSPAGRADAARLPAWARWTSMV